MPYQLVYGLYPFMPIEYIIPTTGRNKRDNTPMRVSTSKITELEKVQEARMHAIEIARIQQ